ncbi:MAG: FMN-binding protein [Candidatus Omnitrophica bacterium]|nr:FMN-binding protein [Candidatus Omnitrophota bacterium]
MKRIVSGNNAIKMITALLAVGILSAVSLVFIYQRAIPKIEANVREETKEAIESIFPGAAKIEKIEGKEIFRVEDAGGRLLGYAFPAEGNGYQGIIKLIAGTDPDISVIKGMKVLESQETPGLGAEIDSKDFRAQFAGLSIERPVEYVKNRKPEKPYQIEAITGATISSRAVVTILNNGIREIRKALKDEP